MDRTKPQTQPRLTDRDKTVLRFIFHGLTNKDIAARLERTRAQLVKVALEQYKEQL